MHVLLFLKAPRPGTVKTRLAETVGDVKAMEIYIQLVERQLKLLPENAEVEIHFAPPDAGEEMRKWLGEELSYIPQCEGDLGDRLTYGVRKAFAEGAETVACIGGDCPGLQTPAFKQAEDALRKDQDLVVGPTFDGGYYLIAMKRHHPQLFEQIPWSHHQTLNVTLQRAEENALNVTLLDPLADVDREADWLDARSLYDL